MIKLKKILSILSPYRRIREQEQRIKQLEAKIETITLVDDHFKSFCQGVYSQIERMNKRERQELMSVIPECPQNG